MSASTLTTTVGNIQGRDRSRRLAPPPARAPHNGVTSGPGEGDAGGRDENPGGGEEGGGEPGLFCDRLGSGFAMSEVYFSARPYAPAQKRQFLIHFHPSRLVVPGSRIVAVAGRSAGPPLIDSDPYGPVGRTTRCPWPGSRTGPTGAAPTARACSRARRRRRRPFGAQCRQE